MRHILLLILLTTFVSSPLSSQSYGYGEICSCTTQDTGRVFKVVSQMPLFNTPGCDDSMTYAERKQCADIGMLDFVYGNLNYPVIAYENRTEGMAVISFIVEPNGCISTPRIVRNPGNGTGEEALRLVKLMMGGEPSWVSGINYDELVRVQFNLPVKFSLRNEDDIFVASEDVADYYVVCQTMLSSDTTGLLQAFDAYELDEQFALTFTSMKNGKYVLTMRNADGRVIETQTLNVAVGENMVLLQPHLFDDGDLHYEISDFNENRICHGIAAMY